MKKIILFLLLVTFVTPSISQNYFPNNESVQNKNQNFTALINAKIYVTPRQVIEKGTLLIQNGKVVSSGKDIVIPKNSIIVNLEGKTIYPSFIDMYTNFGVEKPRSTGPMVRGALYDTKKSGYYWNEHLRAEVNAFDTFKYDETKAEEFLKAGFGVVGTHVPDGIARGTGSLIALNNFDKGGRLIAPKVTNHFGFTRSAISAQSYPSSLMGMMALLRQMYHDMDWYKKGNSDTKDVSLEAMIENQKLVQLFATEDKLNSLRAGKIAKEFGVTYVMKGSGNEFERIEEIKNTNSKFIIPINFPEAYDVSDPNQANQMELKDFRFWNQAPSNLKVLSDNGISFALTTENIKKMDQFKTNLLKAIQYGFDTTKALEALTTVPASILGKSNEIGSLNTGSQANFIITSGDYFDKKTLIHENWVQGNRYVVNDMNSQDIRGTYDLVIENETYKWKISGDIGSPKSDLTKADAKKMNSKITIVNEWMSAVIKPADSLSTNFIRLSSYLNKTSNLSGKAIFSDGKEVSWKATKTADFKAEPDSKKETKTNPVQPVTFPNVAFGNPQKPAVQNMLFKNATVWTNEKEGILQSADVLIKNGKIAAVGKNLSDPTATIINAEGKHLTAGIIDEHSHIAISKGVNEGGHNSSAEVSIQDVVNSEDPNIYRDLAGGVTVSQLLHGSANPIGGQSAIVKWKWGQSPEEMLYKNQPKFIKFALGENVKQSNWGNVNPTRFPQTRMGVEQVFIDYFQRAKEYDLAWKSYNSSKKGKAPRVDLDLQTLAEILNKNRFISCHSYVQSEILMLMNVAEKFNFRVNTYTHILEGYKVADKMKDHGVGASTFSDWWAYKFEVNDAIPFNGPIMHNKGIVVAYNSDDAEMSRRLNQEAAKAVKYGNVSEEDAWKFVTLNPAKLLHIDDKVGSIKVGKDADVVLWNTNPLSIYAKAEKTIIEGVVYFDIQKDEEQRKAIAKERTTLIGQLLEEKNKGMITQEPKKAERTEYHCDSMEY
jgi:imidazolonepropionase-like amidohydrolase